MIEIRNVSHRFGDRQVLDGLDLTITERRVAVIGANGSGKSTFARLLNGLLVPDSGTVGVDGSDTRADAKAVRRKVGFVFQDPDAQIVMPLVEEDVAFGLKSRRLPAAEVAEKVDAVLDRFGLTALRQQQTHRLSAGEKQLLALSSVLVMEPAYVVFDEPTTMLDLRNKRMIHQVIAGLAQTAILVSHDLELLQDFERVLVFDGGRVVYDAAPVPAVARYREMMNGT